MDATTTSHAEAMLDDALAATFPASDPPATAVVTGVNVIPIPIEQRRPMAQPASEAVVLGRLETLVYEDGRF